MSMFMHITDRRRRGRSVYILDQESTEASPSVCLNTQLSAIIRAGDTKFDIMVPIFSWQILYISKSIIYIFEYTYKCT